MHRRTSAPLRVAGFLASHALCQLENRPKSPQFAAPLRSFCSAGPLSPRRTCARDCLPFSVEPFPRFISAPRARGRLPLWARPFQVPGGDHLPVDPCAGASTTSPWLVGVGRKGESLGPCPQRQKLPQSVLKPQPGLPGRFMAVSPRRTGSYAKSPSGVVKCVPTVWIRCVSGSYPVCIGWGSPHKHLRNRTGADISPNPARQA